MVGEQLGQVDHESIVERGGKYPDEEISIDPGLA